MLLLIFLLIPIVLADEIVLDKNYVITIYNNTLKSIDLTGTLNMIESKHRTDEIESKDTLTELNLSGLGLQDINENVFDNLVHLKSLNLANNSLSNLPRFIFSNLTNLENLSLADNDMWYFERGVFVGLSSLKSLNISNNREMLIFMGAGDYFGLPKSCDIFMKGNRFVYINPDVFNPPPDEFLSYPFYNDTFKNHTIDVQESIISYSTDIILPSVEIDIRVKICKEEGNVNYLGVLNKNESLSSDCSEVEIIHNMGILSLQQLGISTFKKGWYQLEDLPIRLINLRGNNIVRLTSEMLNDLPDTITTVNLADNKIERLEKGTIECQHLKYVNFKGNFISEIEEDALNKTNLTTLVIDGNRLKDTKFMTTLLSNLEKINLSKKPNS